MRIDGQWLLCKDGVVRPVIQARVMNIHGEWEAVRLLADCGADCTVLCQDDFDRLGFDVPSTVGVLEGIGGRVESFAIETQIQFPESSGRFVTFRGTYAVSPDSQAMDISLLGRDITNHFAMIVDRPSDVVTLLSQRHRYKIVAE